MNVPTRPPVSMIRPIFTSMLLRLYCATAPETDDATTCAFPVATATAVGPPRNVKSGVKRIPPPRPKIPERNPAAAPSARYIATETDISAIGKYRFIKRSREARAHGSTNWPSGGLYATLIGTHRRD